MTFTANPTAIVDDGAIIGDGTEVWHWARICTKAQIGENCSLGQNVCAGSGAVTSNGVKIQNNVSVYDNFILEDDVSYGPTMVSTNVINTRMFIQRKNEYEMTLVRDGASLGSNSTVVCGVTVGASAPVAARAAVTRDVPDFALVVGAPARQIDWVSANSNRIDVPLDRAGEATCPDDGSHYRLRNGVMARA